jgi:nucleosome binding factor SPN SPT16 subunit
LGNKKT